MEATATAAPDEIDGAVLADLIQRLLRGVETGSKQWTVARRKDSLQRALAIAKKGDAGELIGRLQRLLGSWSEGAADVAAAPVEADAALAAPALATHGVPPIDPASVTVSDGMPIAPAMSADFGPSQRIIGSLTETVRLALPQGEHGLSSLSTEFGQAQAEVQARAANGQDAQRFDALSEQARRVLRHRQHLAEQTHRLCDELTASLVELAEDDGWARGQCDAMRRHLEEGLSARSVRAVGTLLHETRERHQHVRAERAQARDALKTLIQRMLVEVGELGSHTGRFSDSVGRYAQVIESADSLESLAATVREMVEESRTVSSLVAQSQTRLRAEHSRATELSERVHVLEEELRRLSDEVATDPLTGVANRRGMMNAFATEQSRCERNGSPLSVGLLDIDNFKRLNDTLGHAAGDEALVALASGVQKLLRPIDRIARYGGEEFVVVLPETAVAEAQQVLTRLQRSLSGSLFLHENQPVFVTFSAGVSQYQGGERLEQVLERADEALYEAKRTGKNRTCIG